MWDSARTLLGLGDDSPTPSCNSQHPSWNESSGDLGTEPSKQHSVVFVDQRTGLPILLVPSLSTFTRPFCLLSGSGENIMSVRTSW